MDEDILGLTVAVGDVQSVDVGQSSHEAVNPLQDVPLGRSEVVDGSRHRTASLLILEPEQLAGCTESLGTSSVILDYILK